MGYSRDNLPPCPEGWIHLDGGTFREPKMGESFLNANSIDPNRFGGIKPEFMIMSPHIHLDTEIPTKERWIIIPT